MLYIFVSNALSSVKAGFFSKHLVTELNHITNFGTKGHNCRGVKVDVDILDGLGFVLDHVGIQDAFG